MRQNTRKPKPKTNNNPKPNPRSYSVRDIIGDRRFNQFRRANTPQTEGVKKVKRVEDGVGEGDGRRNLGGNVSSAQCEATKERQRFLDDFAAKTSEYAFFKRMKDGSFSNAHVTPNCHDSEQNDVRQNDQFRREETPNVQKDKLYNDMRVTANCHDRRMNDIQQSDHFIREDTPNVQKESVKYARSAVPMEKERKDSHYSLFSTSCCGPKSTEENNVFGVNATNVQYATPGESNWLSSSVSRKTKASGIKDVFSVKREKLRQRIADKSLYDASELSSKGFDLISALISRILPENQESNSQWKADSKCKVPSFSDTDQATLTKGQESYKRKSESQHIAYLDDGFSRSMKRPIDVDLLEWHPTDSDSPFPDHASRSSIPYYHCHAKAYKRQSNESQYISYLDDDFSRSTRKPINLEPAGLESSIPYNHCHAKAYKRQSNESCHISYLDDDFSRSTRKLLNSDPAGLESSIQYNHRSTEGDFRHPNFEVNSMVSFDEPRIGYESSNYQELEEPRFCNEPKLLEPPRSRPLLLGWEDNSEKDEFQFSTSSTSQHDDYQLFKPNALFKEDIPSLPYTPERLMAVEECRMNFPPKDYTWSMDESFNEKEHRSSESCLFLIQSPVDNRRRFSNTALHSFVVDHENEENLVFSSDQFPEGRVKPYSSSSYAEPFHDFDHIEYHLLLHDTCWNDTL